LGRRKIIITDSKFQRGRTRGNYVLLNISGIGGANLGILKKKFHQCL